MGFHGPFFDDSDKKRRHNNGHNNGHEAFRNLVAHTQTKIKGELLGLGIMAVPGVLTAIMCSLTSLFSVSSDVSLSIYHNYFVIACLDI